jgi:hypothetical protein
MRASASEGEPDYGSKTLVAAVGLTSLGAVLYLPYALGFFASYLGSGLVPLQFWVLFGTDMGVLGCSIMMAAIPKRHLVWGINILLFSAVAIAVDGYILVNIAAAGALGFLWSAPLAFVIVGGILSILWKPRIKSEEQNTTGNMTRPQPIVNAKPFLQSRLGLRNTGIIAATGVAASWISAFVSNSLYNAGPGGSVCTNNGCAILVVISWIGYYSAIIFAAFFAYDLYKRFQRSRLEKKQS